MKRLHNIGRHFETTFPFGTLAQRLQHPVSGWWNRHHQGLVITEDSAQLGIIRRGFGTPRSVSAETLPFDRSQTDGWPVRIAKTIGWAHDRLQGHGLLRTPVNVALLGQDISFRRLILPLMPPQELAEAIRWEGNKLFPFDLNESVVHHEIVRRFDHNNSTFVAVNIIAAGKRIIDSLYGQFQATGLVPGQVTYLPCRLARLVSMQTDIDRQACHLVLYLDGHHSLAVFVVNGYLDFCQEFSTQPVAGLVGTDAIDNLAPLTDELNSLIDLYHAQERENSVQSIILCGQFAGDSNIAAALSETTGLSCRPAAGMGDATRTHAGPTEPHPSIAALLTALAPSHIHPLAPAIYHQQQEKRLFFRRLAIAAAVTLTGLSGWQYATYGSLSDLSHRLESTKAERMEIENSPAYWTFQALSRDPALQPPSPTATPSLVNSRYQAMMKELSQITPPSLTLTLLDIRWEEGRPMAQLDGHIRLNDFSPEIVLARYVEALSDSPFYDGVTVVSHQKQRDETGLLLNFQLQMSVRL
jgi:hypothetical protein